MLLIPVSLGTYLTWMLIASFFDALNGAKWPKVRLTRKVMIGLSAVGLVLSQAFLPNGTGWGWIGYESLAALILFPIVMAALQFIQARRAKISVPAVAEKSPRPVADSRPAAALAAQ